jgi:hypothetical protein
VRMAPILMWQSTKATAPRWNSSSEHKIHRDHIGSVESADCEESPDASRSLERRGHSSAQSVARTDERWARISAHITKFRWHNLRYRFAFARSGLSRSRMMSESNVLAGVGFK